MAPVLLKHVVRFSSQDCLAGKMENLLRSQTDPSAGRWCCSKEECSKTLEGEFELERASYISHIDIGNYGSAFVEVLVGNSMWPLGKDYISLVPSSMLMTPSDCRQWIQTKSVRMFHGEKLNRRAQHEQWDRIRVICRQPYRKDKQFGLSFIRIGAPDDVSSGSPTTPGENTDLAVMWSAVVTPQSSKQRRELSVTKSGASPGLRNCLRQFKGSPETSLNRGSKMLQAALVKPRTPKQGAGVSRKPPAVRGDTEDDGNIDNLRSNDLYTWKGMNDNWQAEDVSHANKKKPFNSKPPEATPEKKWSLNGDVEDEVTCFLGGIEFSKLDMETVTYSDLRATMESQRGCILTKPEKKIFIKMAKEFIGRLMEEQERASDAPIDLTDNSKEIASNASQKSPRNQKSQTGHETLTPKTSSLHPSSTLSSASASRDEQAMESRSHITTKRSRKTRNEAKSSQISIDSDDDLPSCSSYPEKKNSNSPSTAFTAFPATTSSSLEDDELPSYLSYEPPTESSTPNVINNSTRTGRTVVRNDLGFQDGDVWDEVPKKKTKFSSTSTTPKHTVTIEEYDDDDLPSYLSYDHHGKKAPSVTSDSERGHIETSAASQKNEPYKECPICTNLFLASQVEGHASECTNFPPEYPPKGSASGSSHDEDLVDCPICVKRLPVSQIMVHANECAERSVIGIESSQQDAAISS